MYPEDRGPTASIPASGPAPVLLRVAELQKVGPGWACGGRGSVSSPAGCAAWPAGPDSVQPAASQPVDRSPCCCGWLSCGRWALAQRAGRWVQSSPGDVQPAQLCQPASSLQKLENFWKLTQAACALVSKGSCAAPACSRWSSPECLSGHSIQLSGSSDVRATSDGSHDGLQAWLVQLLTSAP